MTRKRIRLQLRAELRKAEEAAWAWYLEWGGIARAVITDKRALYKLGFGRKPRVAAHDATNDATNDAVNDADSDTRTLAVVVNATPVNALPVRTMPAESSVGFIAAPQLAAASAVSTAGKVGVA